MKGIDFMADKVEIKNKLLEETLDLVTQLYCKFRDDEIFTSDAYNCALKIGTPDEVRDAEKERDFWKGECEKLQNELTAVKEHVQSLEKAIIKRNKIIDKLTKE